MNLRAKAKRLAQQSIKWLTLPGMIGLSIALIFLLIRVSECATNPNGISWKSTVHYLRGIRFDLIFASIIAFLAILPALFFKDKKGWSKGLFIYLMIIPFALFTWLLSEYYLIAELPLNQSILVYSSHDMLQIAGSSFSASGMQFLRFVVLLIGVIFIPLAIIRLEKRYPKVLAVMVMLVFLMPLANRRITPNIVRHTSNITYYQQINKLSYLIKAVLFHTKSAEDISSSQAQTIAQSYQEKIYHKQFISPTFPFFCEMNKENVLEPFFNLSETPPNIFIIIVESLSSRFSGPKATIGSFTPFIDSLATEGLYWHNFVSTSERTFQVLPSALASAPYGKKGFMALIEENPYPNFLSLPHIFAEHGYHNHFYYGGWLHFDRMDAFTNTAGFEHILHEDKFDDTYTKHKQTSDGFSWGYPDHELFRRIVEFRDSLQHTPTLEVALTLSMHDQFNLENEEYWISRYNEYIQNLEVDKKHKQLINNRSEFLINILYTDDALRTLFSELEKQPGFENTIFMIFGDHNMGIGEYSPIEKYAVPLIIYSPLLKKKQSFPALSSTADIAPTLLNLLATKYSFKAPNTTHWLGNPLDTSSHFRSRNFVPFMRVERNINELLLDTLFYSEGRLFVLKEGLKLHLLDNPEFKEMMEETLHEFNQLNLYVCNNDLLFPSWFAKQSYNE